MFYTTAKLRTKPNVKKKSMKQSVMVGVWKVCSKGSLKNCLHLLKIK